jgi:hypothetical protein
MVQSVLFDHAWYLHTSIRWRAFERYDVMVNVTWLHTYSADRRKHIRLNMSVHSSYFLRSVPSVFLVLDCVTVVKQTFTVEFIVFPVARSDEDTHEENCILSRTSRVRIRICFLPFRIDGDRYDFEKCFVRKCSIINAIRMHFFVLRNEIYDQCKFKWWILL